MDLFFAILASFGVSLAVSVPVAIAIKTVVNRKLFNLECALGDTQRVVKSLKGADYTTTRWNKKAKEDAELEELMRSAKPQTSIKYDNDFSTAREFHG